MTLERTLEVVDATLHHALFGAATGALLGLVVAAIDSNPLANLCLLALAKSAAWSVRMISMKRPEVRYESQGFYRDRRRIGD